jgi:hypothetical protein
MAYSVMQPACWWAIPWAASGPEGKPPSSQCHGSHSTPKAADPAAADLLALEKVHRGLGRAVLTLGTISFVTYCFVNDDKAWARRILNAPKKWWQ